MKFLKLPTENLSQIILAVWIIFSVIFIGKSIWQSYTFDQAEMREATTAAYQQAQVDIVDQLIRQAETCEAFPIFAGETQIKLKKVGCE